MKIGPNCESTVRDIADHMSNLGLSHWKAVGAVELVVNYGANKIKLIEIPYCLFILLFFCLSDSNHLTSTATCHAQFVHIGPGASISQENYMEIQILN